MKSIQFIALFLFAFVMMSGHGMRNKIPMRGGGGHSKSAWAHLEGSDPETVKAAILSERPELNVQIVPHDAMVTMDMREDRVRLFVKDGKVVRSPRIG